MSAATLVARPGFFDWERIIADSGYNRWAGSALRSGDSPVHRHGIRLQKAVILFGL